MPLANIENRVTSLTQSIEYNQKMQSGLLHQLNAAMTAEEKHQKELDALVLLRSSYEQFVTNATEYQDPLAQGIYQLAAQALEGYDGVDSEAIQEFITKGTDDSSIVPERMISCDAGPAMLSLRIIKGQICPAIMVFQGTSDPDILQTQEIHLSGDIARIGTRSYSSTGPNTDGHLEYWNSARLKIISYTSKFSSSTNYEKEIPNEYNLFSSAVEALMAHAVGAQE